MPGTWSTLGEIMQVTLQHCPDRIPPSHSQRDMLADTCLVSLPDVYFSRFYGLYRLLLCDHRPLPIRSNPLPAMPYHEHNSQAISLLLLAAYMHE